VEPKSIPPAALEVGPRVKPGVGPRVKPGVESRVKPGAEPGANPQVKLAVEPRLTSGVEPRVKPRMEPQAEQRTADRPEAASQRKLGVESKQQMVGRREAVGCRRHSEAKSVLGERPSHWGTAAHGRPAVQRWVPKESAVQRNPGALPQETAVPRSSLKPLGA
jgi:hypothetical protein